VGADHGTAREHEVSTASPRRKDRERPAWGKLALLLLVFLALFLAWRYTPLADYLEPEKIADWARSLGRVPWSPLILIAAYTPAAVVMFPRPLITVLAVIAYGPVAGFFTAIAGIAAATLALYSVGRYLPEGTVRKLAGRKFERVTPILRKHSFVAAFAISIAAIAPFPVEAMAAGAIRLKVWHYLAGTLAGMIPGTLVTTLLADEVETALRDPTRVNVWLIVLGLAVIGTLTYIVRRKLTALEEQVDGAAKGAHGHAEAPR
jgi:phospholipase D1/2